MRVPSGLPSVGFGWIICNKGGRRLGLDLVRVIVMMVPVMMMPVIMAELIDVVMMFVGFLLLPPGAPEKPDGHEQNDER